MTVPNSQYVSRIDAVQFYIPWWVGINDLSSRFTKLLVIFHIFWQTDTSLRLYQLTLEQQQQQKPSTIKDP